MSTFGLSDTHEIIFPLRSITTFPGHKGYSEVSDSPVSIIKITEPAQPILKYTGDTVLQSGEITVHIPYIVDSPGSLVPRAQGPTAYPSGRPVIKDPTDGILRLHWENDQIVNYGLTAGQQPNTIYYYVDDGVGGTYQSPSASVNVTINPWVGSWTAGDDGINRNFKFIIGEGNRVEPGVTWSILVKNSTGAASTKRIEYGPGIIEPHAIEFLFTTSSVTGYEITKYMLEQPLDDVETTYSAIGRDFNWTKRNTGFFESDSVIAPGEGCATIFPAGSILFVNEIWTSCEGMTTPSPGGITISFGLAEPSIDGSYGSSITNWDTPLATFGISDSRKMLFTERSLADFATGSVYYTQSPIGIIKLSDPAMLVISVVGGNLSTGTLIKCFVPYIVDQASANAVGVNSISLPNAGGYVTGLENVGTGAEVYVNGTEDPAQIRTISVQGNLTIQQTATEIIIGTPFDIGPDTYIYIKVDSSGSLGDPTRSQFFNLKETALKTALKDFFATEGTERDGNTDPSTNGSDRYDNQVFVNDESQETFLTLIRPNVGSLAVDPFPASASNVITLYYFDEISPRYTDNNSTPIADSDQTQEFRDDITLIKSTINSFPSPDYLKAFAFNITSGNYGAMNSLMTHLNLNSGSYSGAFGLNFESDGVTPRPDRFNFRMVLNNVNPSNPLYPSTIPSAPGVWPADDPDAINSTSFDSYEEYFLSTVTSALNQAGSEFAVKGELKSGPITDDPYLDMENNIAVWTSRNKITNPHQSEAKLYGQIYSVLPPDIVLKDNDGRNSGNYAFINWNRGNNQTIDLGSASNDVTVNFNELIFIGSNTNPTVTEGDDTGKPGAHYLIKVVQNPTQSYDLIWPLNVQNQSNISINQATSSVSLVSLFYDGSDYYPITGVGIASATPLALPVPNIIFDSGTYSYRPIDVWDPLTNGIHATQALLYNAPILVNTDFTSDHFSDPNNRIFIEMVVKTRRKSKWVPTNTAGNRKKRIGSKWSVPSKHIADVGQDTSLPWLTTGSFWSRAGNHYVYDYIAATHSLLGIDRPNHYEVYGYTLSTYNIWEYFTGRFEYGDVAYYNSSTYNPSSPSIEVLNTLIPISGKRNAGQTYPNPSTNVRFSYSSRYTPLYCAFRYIQWLPNANGGLGQIISGPLSKTLKITGYFHPFQVNYIQSAQYGLPVADVAQNWSLGKTGSGWSIGPGYNLLKVSWESNLP
jgi:hypothetical protein